MAMSDRVRRHAEEMGRAYASTADTEKYDYAKMVKDAPDLEAAYAQFTSAEGGKHKDYWTPRIKMAGATPTREEFGVALAGESSDIAADAYRGHEAQGTTDRKAVGTFKTGQTPVAGGYQHRVAPLKKPTVVSSGDPSGDKGGDKGGSKGKGWNNPQGTIYDTSTTKMELATLTDQMDLSNKLTEIINTNSPLFKAATTRAMQAMAKRGIVNSSIAQGEVMNAIMAVAMPLAQAEIKTLTDNLYYNTDWSNKDKAMANEYAYNNMLKKLQGAVDYQLKLLSESGLNYRQRMQTMGSLMGQGYGEDDMPQPSVWEAWSEMFPRGRQLTQ